MKIKIIVDTNILISATFYAGFVKKILDELDDKNFIICANSDIVEEYYRTKDKMISKKLGRFNEKFFQDFLNKLQSFEIVSDLKICRDSKDDKFLNCAIDAKAIYIVSGDKDLLTIKNFCGIEIMTAREFYEKVLR